MKFLRKPTQYMPFDHKRKHDIWKELKTSPVLVEISSCNDTWIQHVGRMERSRLVHAVMKYQPARKRNTGHT
jgi:hypothetical protein